MRPTVDAPRVRTPDGPSNCRLGLRSEQVTVIAMETVGGQQFGVLWQQGDSWRNLAFDFAGTQRVTVVTRSGTTYLVDMEDRTAIRFPGTWSGHLRSDGEWFSFEQLMVATPCGIVICRGPGSYRFTTGVHLLLDGHYPDWAGAFGPLPDTERATERFSDHPPVACGALYCQSHPTRGAAVSTG